MATGLICDLELQGQCPGHYMAAAWEQSMTPARPPGVQSWQQQLLSETEHRVLLVCAGGLTGESYTCVAVLLPKQRNKSKYEDLC